ncbi:hypothetical protein AU509_03380 [Lonsdalea britannica]|uniref:Zinc ribbon-containing protein n=1 Tax=Lonsdalea britannica TaxID=1082704 RepID=A0AAD0SLK0_9GAMM|nr:zinc ribbon-containing protein [Lonsdalea britannica]AXW87338.1 hypothetical protein CKQ53_10320 [Lonsdalea britannica]OSM99846.1 hypothetical protein AU509_03380 [Lonsdalea britannica]OSN06144.1 hypothetical protein AU510_08220 [Lonsdalea britannica]
MNKVSRYYQTLMSDITARLHGGERDMAKLIDHARHRIADDNAVTQQEGAQILQAIRRDLAEFGRSYEESRDESTDSVFMRVIKESLWQELADITDKTQLEWRELFQDVNHHGVYHSGEVVGLGNLVCENCHYHLTFYTPEVLPRCPKCSHDQFHRQPFQP